MKYVIKKTIEARNMQEAIKKESKIAPSEVWIDSDQGKELTSAIGFELPPSEI